MYNYREAIKSDIRDHIEWNYSEAETATNIAERREEWEEELHDVLWCTDSVTGNASGSYTFSTWQAEEYIAHNWDILEEALVEFGCYDCNPIARGAEWCDVTIRCYLLGECIAAVLDEMEAAQ